MRNQSKQQALFKEIKHSVVFCISIVLGVQNTARQDQANKSAGWMPGH